MGEKYYVSRDHYNKFGVATLKGNRRNMTNKGLDFGDLSKILFQLHQQARNVAKLGLQEN